MWGLRLSLLNCQNEFCPLCHARSLAVQRTERSRHAAWRRSADKSFPRNGRSARRQCSSRPRNRHGSRPVGRYSACSHRALSATRLVPIHRRASKPRRGCGDDDSFLPRSCAAQSTNQAGQGLLRIGIDARCVRNRNGTRGTVHCAVRWHKDLAGKVAHHQIQGMDAQC